MPNPNHLLGSKPGRINIITFTGAHGTGKSTLIAGLEEASDQADLGRVRKTPSCSTFWFQKYQQEARSAAREIPQTYDDINRLGLRDKMQGELPGDLKDLVLDTFMEAIRRGLPGEQQLILVDRWFGDIATYTSLEMSEEKAEKYHELNFHFYNELISLLQSGSERFNGEVYLTHVFIPLAACAHAMPRGNEDGKMRATQPAVEWEQVYVHVNRYTPAERTVVISSPDRLCRVAEVFDGALR